MRDLPTRFLYAAVLSICLAAPAVADGVRQATLLYFTDAHQLAPVIDRLGERGGGARLATVVRSVRTRDPGTLSQSWTRSSQGALLLRVLEHGVSRVAQRSGAFCQVSGMRYTYNPEAPVGGRIIKAGVRGRPLGVDSIYSVALPGYLVAGGDGFPMLRAAQILVGPSAAPEDVVVLADYCRKISIIDARIEGRISIR